MPTTIPTIHFTRFMFGILTSAFVGACGISDLGSCPPDSGNMQAAGRMIVSARCLTCHNSSLSVAARQGAPEELDFDDLSIAREWAGEMYGEAREGVMPPGARLPESDVELVRVWLACGAP